MSKSKVISYFSNKVCLSCQQTFHKKKKNPSFTSLGSFVFQQVCAKTGHCEIQHFVMSPRAYTCPRLVTKTPLAKVLAPPSLTRCLVFIHFQTCGRFDRAKFQREAKTEFFQEETANRGLNMLFAAHRWKMFIWDHLQYRVAPMMSQIFNKFIMVIIGDRFSCSRVHRWWSQSLLYLDEPPVYRTVTRKD